MNISLFASALVAIGASLASTAHAQTIFGTTCVDSAGNFPTIDYPASSWIKSTAPTNDEVTLTGAIPGLNAALFAGIYPGGATSTPLDIIGATGCTLYVGSLFASVPRTVDANGEASVTFTNWPMGTELLTQWAMIDFGAPRPLQIVTTNAMRSTPPSVMSAFRLSDIDLRDPHVSIEVQLLPPPIPPLCVDATDVPVTGLNPLLQEAITQDSDGDMLLDLSFMLLFRPNDPAQAGGTIDFVAANCSSPIGSTQCMIDAAFLSARTTFTNGTNGCIAVEPGTTSGYSPGVAAPTNGNNCFSTGGTDISLSILGIPLPLEDVQIGGEYVGNPPTAITNGLIKGFVPEAVADAVILPPTSPVSPGQALSSLLHGGTGNCSNLDDKDLGPDGVTVGWWVYLNFEADAVPLQ